MQQKRGMLDGITTPYASPFQLMFFLSLPFAKINAYLDRRNKQLNPIHIEELDALFKCSSEKYNRLDLLIR